MGSVVDMTKHQTIRQLKDELQLSYEQLSHLALQLDQARSDCKTFRVLAQIATVLAAGLTVAVIWISSSG